LIHSTLACAGYDVEKEQRPTSFEEYVQREDKLLIEVEEDLERWNAFETSDEDYHGE